MSVPLLYESHMHTPLCKHAVGNPEDYAEVAEQRGLKGIIVTCHNPVPGGWSASVRMRVEEYGNYIALVERARNEWKGRVDVRLGLECDYVPGMEPWIKELLSRAELHHVLGSIHPQISDYIKAYFKGDWIDYFKTYYEHLALAAETGFFDTLAHPDIVKNAAPREWNLELIWENICSALDRISKAGTAMELNTSGLYKAIPEMNPGISILKEMSKRQIPVVIGADAHQPERVADHYLEALDLLEEAGYQKVSFFLDRKRQDVDLDLARASLKQENVVL